MMESVTRFIERRFTPKGGEGFLRAIAAKSVTRFKDRVRRPTRRHRSAVTKNQI
jgi:hypothetical protein